MLVPDSQMRISTDFSCVSKGNDNKYIWNDFDVQLIVVKRINETSLW